MQPPGRPTVVVVGAGMAGGKVVEELLARSPQGFSIRMFGAERGGTYNRILLSHVLGGQADPGRLWTHPLDWYEKQGVGVHVGVKAGVIDREQRIVRSPDGKVAEPYDILILATGSRPFVPPLPGKDLRGVFVFRTLDDCSAIGSFAQESTKAVVLGGGLLGLEAARGLQSHGLAVTVVEQAVHPMPQQLDATAGQLLKRKLEALGLTVLCGAGIQEIIGEDGAVTGVRLADGATLQADLVVISCGIRPNVDEAKAAGLAVERAIVVDDQMRTSDPAIFAVGECTEHRGRLIGLVEPAYAQARVLADVLSGANTTARYDGWESVTVLKVMDVDLVSMGAIHGDPGCEVLSHLDPQKGIYKKLVLKDNRLVGAILLGTPDIGQFYQKLFRQGEPLTQTALELLEGPSARDQLLEGPGDLKALADDTQICNCNTVCKGTIAAAIGGGAGTIAAVGAATRAGTGCGTCQPLLAQLLTAYGKAPAAPVKNKIEEIKDAKNGLDCLPDLLALADGDRWQEMTEADKQRAKWYGLFFRQPTPGHFMLRLRLEAGRIDSCQLRVIADLSDQYGKGFCDLTTRQQIQLRWFTLADVPDIFRRLEEAGLTSKQTGLDNVRGICGCPVAGLSQHELLDATPVIRQLNELILDNREFTNLPRKFNVTITGCLENCCHTETQDIALAPAIRELDGAQVNGFNVFVGGKQGSGGYRPASPLDVFVRPDDAALLCAEITRIFRDHGARGARNKARLSFLIDDRGLAWFRAELEKRWGQKLLKAGQDMRKKHHVDHLGFHPQKHKATDEGPALFYAGLLVPVGRITTAQLRGVADLADCYGSGAVRVTVGQNLIIPNVPEHRIGALSDEPLLKELPIDPSPILRGLVACTGTDYCGMALVDTKTYALEIARELERRTEGKKVKPLSIHWSGCPASCGLHQVATIGLQGCRSRVEGKVVDAAHVCVNGRAGPQPVVATDLMYDVPITTLASALEPLVLHLPR